MHSAVHTETHKPASANRLMHTIQPAYTVGSVTTGLSQSTVTFSLFLYPSAPLFLLSSLNLNSARFPQCAVHRSLFLALCLSVIVSLLLFCSPALFFSLISTPPSLRLKDKRVTSHSSLCVSSCPWKWHYPDGPCQTSVLWRGTRVSCRA